MRFASPAFLALLVFVPLVLMVPFRRESGTTLVYSSIRRLRALGGVSRRRQLGWIGALRMLSLVLVVFALGRPQLPGATVSRRASGVEIMLAIDVSGSMKAQDFEVDGEQDTRLAAVQSVVRDFVGARHDVRIGVVVCAEYACTQCPLTLNYDVLLGLLDGFEFGVAGDTTAIGNALARSALRLKDSDGKSKVVILLSDGASNAGNISIDDAIAAAQAYDLRVHTIAMGTGEPTDMYVVDEMGLQRSVRMVIELDEAELERIAEQTGGRFYRAADTENLQQIYAEIDALERAPHAAEVIESWRELFPLLLLLAVAVLALEALLARTRYLKVP